VLSGQPWLRCACIAIDVKGLLGRNSSILGLVPFFIQRRKSTGGMISPGNRKKKNEEAQGRVSMSYALLANGR
jgi:hypothetical protein